MSAQPSWHQFPVAHRSVPTLLVSTSFTPTPASYAVHVTDLANMWSESLDRRAILRRSFDEETAIDPSEDLENMRAFLNKLRAAFDISHPEHSTISLSLSVGDDTAGDLVLHITCVLPRPLKPLKWPMYLKKCPSSTMATKLVVPLVQAQHARKQEIGALVETLREKDAVITKLVDKLEVTGTGLEHVFNMMPGRKKVTRAVAEERVKGLAQFDEAEFRTKFNKAQGEGSSAANLSELIQDVFDSDTGLRNHSELEIPDSSQLDGWWTKLGKGLVTLTERQKEAPKESTPPPLSKPANYDDDEFQVQATPPHLMSAKKRAIASRPTINDDDETTDGEELSQIPDSNPPPRSLPLKASQSAKPSRIGDIGKKKASPTPKSPTVSFPTYAKANEAGDGSETASDAGDAEEVPLQASPPQQASSLPKRGLGRIGGKTKAQPSQLAMSTSPETHLSSSQVSKSAKGKLGHIGKKVGPAGSSQSSQTMRDSERGRSRTPAAGDGGSSEAQEKRPRETSEERADRKRSELQRELDRKAAAGPVKKKRKF
ncbi:Xrcc4-like factor 1 [Pleurostoma richardsiae]|uniref:Non-homologous end-joining factor 1 n=1 Tax=Pleurostoma richardsiae TaxID=41990 RepID=A0AA38R315_9PEZI|nr:Xrcc4-like factor 1 [Pleurostoma richardsiae]